GEGAPLAVYGDYLLFADEEENRLLLNMGGIANFTFLPAGKGMAEVICTDTGPGNTLMDAFMQQEFPGKYFDSDAEVAKQGTVNNQLLNALLDQSFFKLPFPKTTGPELFNLEYLLQAQVQSDCKIIAVEDCMATLNAFSAHSIAKAFKETLPSEQFTRVFMSGGGMHNPLLVETLKGLLPEMEFYSSSNLNINPDAKEAILFALLANECICGNPSFENNKNIPSIAMGKISFPA
ncbi:MAG: anhydro-N-acetylmuramic acid kinase, partial [Ferruginibacter sp.]